MIVQGFNTLFNYDIPLWDPSYGEIGIRQDPDPLLLKFPRQVIVLRPSLTKIDIHLTRG
jgi:hypothetical protein